MNNTNLFASPLETFQFLSMVSYLNTLSDFLYEKKLLPENDQLKPIPIVTSLTNYLDQNNYDIETKSHLVHIFLEDTEFFGANKNESLDTEYVNKTIDYIISSITFSKFYNLYGFLAVTINSTDNLTLPAVKKNMWTVLKNNNYTNDDGSLSILSDLSIRYVLDNLVFPLFPQPEDNNNVIDVDYIYAQAGLTLARATGVNLDNISFNEYISMSQIIEQAVLLEKIDKSALEIFHIPALLYYVCNKTGPIRNDNMEKYLISQDFWTDAYALLFSHLNATFSKINKEKEKDPLYQFQVAYSHFKTRSEIANETLEDLCPLENEKAYEDKNYEDKNYEYRNYPDKTRCESNNELLPDINKIFTSQVEDLTEKYRQVERHLIHKAFGEDLINFIDSRETFIYPSKIHPFIPCEIHVKHYGFWGYFLCVGESSFTPIDIQKLNPSVDLFQIKDNENKVLYALIRENLNMTLLRADLNYDYFNEKLGLEKGTEFDTVEFYDLKHKSENFEVFKNRIADRRAKEFKSQLTLLGYNETTEEFWSEIGKSIAIPFYSCKKAVNEDVKMAITSCLLDATSLIPIVQQATSIGVKLASASFRTALSALGTSVTTHFLRQSVRAALITGVKAGIRMAAVASNKIFTRELFKNIAFSIVRALDPGLELFAGMLKPSVFKVWRLIQKVWKRSNLPYETAAKSLQNVETLAESMVVGSWKNQDVFINTIANKAHGAKYIRTPQGPAELRKVEGEKSLVPVQQVEVSEAGQPVYIQALGEDYGRRLELMREERVIKVVPLGKGIPQFNTPIIRDRGNLPIQLREERYQRSIMIATELAFAADQLVGANIFHDQITALAMLSDYALTSWDRNLNEFVADYLQLRHAPDWSYQYRINNPLSYVDLRFDLELSSSTLQLLEASRLLTNVYGREHVLRSGFDLVSEHQYFISQHLYYDMRFEDYYALHLFKRNGYFLPCNNEFERMRVVNALYTLAFRQIDDSPNLFPALVYKVLKRPNYYQFRVDEIYDSHHILQSFSVNREKQLFLYNQKPKGITQHFLLEVKINNPQFAVDLTRIDRTTFENIVILPDAKFKVRGVEIETIEGLPVKVVKLEEFSITRPGYVAELFNKIVEIRNMPHVRFYS